MEWSDAVQRIHLDTDASKVWNPNSYCLQSTFIFFFASITFKRVFSSANLGA